MTTSSACPEPLVLQQFLHGRTPSPEAAALESHVLVCSKCQATTVQVPGDDPLVAALRQPPGEADRQPTCVVDDLVGRLSRTPPHPPLDAYRIEGYRLLRRIGSGGMGVVFEAEDEKLQRRVAVKMLAAHLAAEPGATERFLREARAAAAIQSDHVVAIHQVGLGHDGSGRSVPYLVMPLLAGESLDAHCRRGRTWSAAEIVRVGTEVALGLEAAHAVGLVHRDIKPANLWIESETGRVKILDFGLVQRRTEGVELTTEGTLLGTPGYLAPEQASGGTVDARADLFSLGCVLYELAVGKSPFAGKNILERLSSIDLDRPVPPHRARPNLPRPLSALILSLLARAPERRPVSAAQVVAALRPLAPVDGKLKQPRRRWLSALGVLACLLVGIGLGAAAWALWGPSEPEQEPQERPGAVVTLPAQSDSTKPPPPDWTLTVGHLEVKDTDAGGKTWDTTLWIGDRPTPDLYVEVLRQHAGLKDRLRSLQDQARVLSHRRNMQSLVTAKERKLATMDRNDALRAQLERELAEFKARHPALTPEEQAQCDQLEREIADLRTLVQHTTPVANNTLIADFNSGALPLAVGETIQVRVWDSDGALQPSQRVGQTEFVVTQAMLDAGTWTLNGFEQVISLQVRFRPVR